MTPLLLSALAFGPAAPDATFDDVRPVLAAHCVGCHGPTKQKGGLRLDRKVDALRGGDGGASIVPGKPADSLLLKKVRSTDAGEQMPPDGDRLSEAQMKALTDWIADGAKWPESVAATDAPHWSFQPVKRPTVPVNREATPSANQLDAFVRVKLAAAGIKPNPPADKRTLLRRLKFDLLGLPPTPEEVEAFEKDTAADAYEKRVDGFLASPQFGERWARHWLDAVRFAESHGFETNVARPNAWPYRDWVIKSFNDDKPYDRFVFEQLAGDTVGADAATGFLVAGAWDQVKSPDPVLTANQRADELHDMVATTGSAFLGLTVGCARCHAHKFDPVSQVDYFRMKAVFAGVQHGERAAKAGEPMKREAELKAAREVVAELEAKLAAFEPLADPTAKTPARPPVSAKFNRERFAPVTAQFVRFVVLATNGAEPCIDELEVFTAGPNPTNVALASAGAKVTSSGDYPGSPDIHRLAFLHDGKYGNGRSWISNTAGKGTVTLELKDAVEIDRIEWARDREERYADRLATKYRIEVSADGKAWRVVASSDDRLPMGSKEFATPPGLTGNAAAKWKQLAGEAAAARAKLADQTRSEMVYAGRFTTPETTFRLHRGDAMAAREAISPGGLERFGAKLTLAEKAADSERRVALAKWIIDPAHPLTARVIVNRLWQHHFGTGLVDTPSDFGRNGGKPSHPELLDWLASELTALTFRASGGRKPPVGVEETGGLRPPLAKKDEAKPWSLKHIHRLIVLSETYRQSSAGTAEGTAKDAQSRLLWRYPPRRLDAEAIRDAILAVTGKLELTGGGPGFDLFEPNGNYVKVYTPKKDFGPAEFRRMVYQNKPRMQLDDTFGAFDCPDGGQIAPKRNASTTPLQALNLLNAPFLVQQAKFLADRAAKDAGDGIEGQVRRAFALAFQRNPSDKELSAAVALAKAHGLPALCRALLNANEFLYVE